MSRFPTQVDIYQALEHFYCCVLASKYFFLLLLYLLFCFAIGLHLLSLVRQQRACLLRVAAICRHQCFCECVCLCVNFESIILYIVVLPSCHIEQHHQSQPHQRQQQLRQRTQHQQLLLSSISNEASCSGYGRISFPHAASCHSLVYLNMLV